MKKSILIILLLSVGVLAACTQLQPFLPEEESPETSSPFSDTLNFTDEDETIDDIIEIDLDEKEYEDVEEAQETVEEELEEENVESQITIDVIEGDEVNLGNLQAADPDGDPIEYTFSKPLDEDGVWQTRDGDEGTYFVDITASDGLLSTTETIKIVVGPSNKGPVIDCPTELNAVEGEVVELPCTIFDREGDEVSFDVTGYATDLTFTTGFEDAGVQTITITATDGNKITTHEVELLIQNTNRAPLVEDIGDIVALEGESVNLFVDAIDPDGDNLEISYPLIFTDDGRWLTEKGDAGTYELEIEVSDGEEEVTVPVTIKVEKVNSAPTLLLANSFEVDEGEEIDLDIQASDVDGDGVTVTIEGFMTTQTYQTTFEDAGEYEVTVTASDGKRETSKTVSITINDVNRPPVFILN